MSALPALAGCGSGGASSEASGIDTTPPQAGSVADSLGADIDTQTSTSTVSANWSGFSDDSGTIQNYWWAIGTTPGGTQVQPWTTVGIATQATNSTLALGVGTNVFVSVRAMDPSNNPSSPSVSNGVVITTPGNGGGGTGGGTMVSSITQWGVSWQFSQPASAGQFCNGDWWVIGPVSIIEISPPAQTVGGRSINGAMVNPVPDGIHGYDSDLYAPYQDQRYQTSLNVALGLSPNSPLVLQPNTSLISTIAQMQPATSGSFSQLKTAAVLTVLSTEPPSDAFRPAYTGNDKTIRFRESQLDYYRLGTLSPAGSVPDVTQTAAKFERVWLDHCPHWYSRYMHPVDNMPDYGRDFCSVYGTGALLLQLNLPHAQKRDLLVRMTQIGIDNMANVQNGCFWEGTGGQCSGRKFPILLAGAVLGDATMSAIGTSHPSAYYGPSHASNSSWFGEDCQTFYVQQTSAGVYNWGYGGYTAAHNGMAEWGNSHTTWTNNDNSNWMADPYRRCCTGNAWVGQTLAARVMALMPAWNHQSYFDYMDRFMQTESPGQWTRSWEPWHEQMWDAHRSQL